MSTLELTRQKFFNERNKILTRIEEKDGLDMVIRIMNSDESFQAITSLALMKINF